MSARLVVDLAAWRHNLRTLTAVAAPAQCWIAVKADAYGHGMLPLARAAVEEGVPGFAVLEVSAALRLRDAGVAVRLFAWLHGADTDFRAAIAGDIELGVSSRLELDRVVAAAGHGSGVARVHLKVDTGLHRNGASREEWPELVAAARDAESAGFVVVEGLWSHLADAGPEADAAALAEFHAAIDVARDLGVDPPLRHLAASSAGIREPEARFDVVRFGIAAYGVSPFDDIDGTGLGLRPVMSLEAEVIAVERDTAVLDVGAADGIPPAPEGAAVLLSGVRAGVLDVGVDTTRVDTGAIAAGAAKGDVAVVFGGEGPAAERWAQWAGTIGDEIVASRGVRRLPVKYRD